MTAKTTKKKKSTKKTRGYSRAFTPKDRGDMEKLFVDKIPGPWWRRICAKIERRGLSKRGLVLDLIKTWDEAPPPVVPEPEVIERTAAPAEAVQLPDGPEGTEGTLSDV